jgi:hypothetical protein
MRVLPVVGDPAGGSGPRRAWASGARLPLVSALALAALPKCPLCVAAYLGVVGSFSSAALGAAWGAPLTAVLLAAALAAPVMRAWRRRGVLPLVAGVAGALALVLGKFAVGSVLLVAAGAVILAAAAVWSARSPSPGSRR